MPGLTFLPTISASNSVHVFPHVTLSKRFSRVFHLLGDIISHVFHQQHLFPRLALVQVFPAFSATNSFAISLSTVATRAYLWGFPTLKTVTLIKLSSNGQTAFLKNALKIANCVYEETSGCMLMSETFYIASK